MLQPASGYGAREGDVGKRWIASLWLAAGCPSKDDDGSTLETDTETEMEETTFV